MDSRSPVDEKGIPVIPHEWQNCDPETLTTLFSPSRFSRLIDPDDAVNRYVKRMEEESETTRNILKHERNVPYGNKPLQVVDFYSPEPIEEDAPVLVYFHGGYWQVMDPASHGVVARQLVPLGAVVAMVGYTLAPGGTLTQMIQECKDAVVFCAKRYPKSRGLYISGHSAGGHLTAMMLAVDWEKEHKLPKGTIKGAVPMSPIFDLRPLVSTSINELLGLTSDTALACSPVCYLDEISKSCLQCRILLIYGDHDPPSFKTQSQHFIQLLKERGIDVPYIKVKERDHFELLPCMAAEDDTCVKAFREMMFPNT